MVTVSLIYILIAQGAPPSQVANPGEIVSKMFARYAAAKTLVGTIKLTQGTQHGSATMDTLLQYERPNKLYIRQVANTSKRKQWLVSGDDKTFSYNAPEHLPGGEGQRLIEPLKKGDGKMFELGDIYGAVTLSLGDRSAPLDIAIARNEDLRFLTYQWPTVAYRGRAELGNEEVHVITGQWREYDQAPITGTFEMYINDSHDLRRYAVRQMVKPAPNAPAVEILSVWDIRLEVGGSPNPALFKVVK